MRHIFCNPYNLKLILWPVRPNERHHTCEDWLVLPGEKPVLIGHCNVNSSTVNPALMDTSVPFQSLKLACNFFLSANTLSTNTWTPFSALHFITVWPLWLLSVAHFSDDLDYRMCDVCLGHLDVSWCCDINSDNSFCETKLCPPSSAPPPQAFVKVASGSRPTPTTMMTTFRLAGRWRSAARWRPRPPRSCSSAGWRTAGRWGAPSAWSSPTPTLRSRREPPTSTSSTSSSQTLARTPAWRHWGTVEAPRSASMSTFRPPQVSHAGGGARWWLHTVCL